MVITESMEKTASNGTICTVALAPQTGVRGCAAVEHCAIVCVMEPARNLPRIGVRELRQNLSVYLRRVQAGETLEVTEHGRPVARLGPTPEADLSPLQRLLAEGRVTLGKGSLHELGLPPERPGRPLSDVLREIRDEERW